VADEERAQRKREAAEAKSARKRDAAQVKLARKQDAADAKATRKREAAAEKLVDDVPEPPSLPGPRGISRRRALWLLTGAIGVLGMLGSLVLAVGALLLALGNDSGTLYSAVSWTCDALIGPLRDLFSFSVANSEDKETLVAWGVGALIYLVVGMFAQIYQRSLVSDD